MLKHLNRKIIEAVEDSAREQYQETGRISPSSFYAFESFIKHVADLSNLTNPSAIYSNFEDLILNEKVKSTDLSHLETSALLPRGFKVKVLQSRKDFNSASDDFVNCVRSYFNTPGDLLTFYKSEKPVACVHVEHKRIMQIKGRHNAPCQYTNEIKDFLESHQTI